MLVTAIEERRTKQTPKGFMKANVFRGPRGKERMRRLMRLVESHRIDLRPLLTRLYEFEDIAKAYELFSSRQGNVLKVAIRVR